MELSKQTLEALIADLFRMQKNSLEIIQMLQELQVSQNDKVIIEWENSDGTTTTYELPSMGFFKKEVERLSQNYENITGLGAKNVKIKNPDGSIRTVIATEAPIEQDPVLAVAKPLFFYKRNNKFSDILLNPAPIVRFDLTNQIKPEIAEVQVRKVLVKADSVQDIDYFNTELNGASIAYDDLITALGDRGITYEEYDDIFRLPPKLPKFSGTFNVVNSKKQEVTKIVDDQEITETKTVYTLNTVLYKDLENDNADVVLKEGAMVIVNADVKDTKYAINTVDTSTRQISVNRVEGSRPIPIGTNKLMIDPSFIKTIELEVPINVDEYMVVFFKPLTPNSNIINPDWGQGTGIYTNELVDFDDQVNNTQLGTFFNSFVQDFGAAAMAITKDNMIPLADAIEPDAPTLQVSDFQVAKINAHKEDLQQIDELRQKFAQKNNVDKEITRLDKAINDQKIKIATGNFKNESEKQQANKELNDLIDERGLKVTEFNTLINDIVARSTALGNVTPKYRVRGFWNIPDPKFIDEAQQIGQQDVVQFEYQYRYLRKDNTTPVQEGQKISAQEVANATIQEEKKATFSRWVSVLGNVREREVDETTTPDEVASGVANPELSAVKKPIWKEEDENNPDTVNINQLDIPITSGENVEIRVRSISEAGYPHKKSAWSESIIVEFPDELIDDVTFIGQTSEQEQLRATFLQELNAVQLPDHLADQVTVGDKFFAHNGDNLAGPERTPENTPIPINQSITELRNEIDRLNAIVSGEGGQIKVAILDELGNPLQDISNNTSSNIFGGYYVNEVENATIPKGEIVSKLFFIEISNVNPADLQLLSYVPGLPEEILPVPPYTGYLFNKEQYDNFRKFWEAPMSLRGIVDNNDFQTHHNDTSEPFIQLPAFQSSQVKGQNVYVRKRDISLNTLFYDKDSTPANNVFLPFQAGSQNEAFIWNESLTTTTPNGNGLATDFCVHIDHPDLELGSDLMSDFANLYNPISKLPERSVETSGQVNYPFFMHSRYFNLQSNQPNGLVQLEYIPYTKELTGGAGVDNFAKKIGFTNNDKYLIGQNTCGSYLFLAPNDQPTLWVGSSVFNIGQTITQGTENSVRIPLIFQYRMTDYFGAGSTGTGTIGGFGAGTLNNLSYAKKIGIDVLVKGEDELFSFDLRFDARYKPRSVAEEAQFVQLKTTL